MRNTAFALVALSVTLLAAAPGVARQASPVTGFVQPYAGVPKYEQYAPIEVASARQINRPIGQSAADRLARKFGLNKKQVFTPKQYSLFISGKGVGGEPAPAKLVDESVRIFTNTTGRPLYANVNGKVTPTVLGSYGLFVSTAGRMMSLANTAAPTRKVNVVIEPGGYLGTWCRQNGCQDTLRMLYRSAYTPEVVYGNKSQQQSGVAELVPNTKGGRSSTVGMSMAPCIWIVNFVLVYALNPKLAAKMPARWAPIPADVVRALEASSTGQVPYSRYASSFRG
jgi:hypothetical protein